MKTTKTTKRCECGGDLSHDYGMLDGEWSKTWSCSNCSSWTPRRVNRAASLVTPSQQKTLDDLDGMGFAVNGMDDHTTPGSIFVSLVSGHGYCRQSVLAKIGRTGHLAVKFGHDHKKAWTTGRKAWFAVQARAL